MYIQCTYTTYITNLRHVLYIRTYVHTVTLSPVLASAIRATRFEFLEFSNSTLLVVRIFLRHDLRRSVQPLMVENSTFNFKPQY